MLLCAVGAGVNLYNIAGRTPIHFAAGNGANTVLRQLLKLNADPNAQVHNYTTNSTICDLQNASFSCS